MIRVRDAALLAYTKLRTRKVRLTVTIVISGLLLSGLAAASFVVRGAFDSINDFSKEGFGQRYIVSAYLNSGSVDLSENADLIAKAEAGQKDLVARKKAAAKQLGIEYDPTSEQPVTNEYVGPNGKVKTLNFSSTVVQQLIVEYKVAHPDAGLPELKKATAEYNPVRYYTTLPSLMSENTPYLKVLKDNQEKYDTANISGEQMFQQTGVDSFVSSWGLMSSGLLKPFMLPNTNAEIGADGSIPVVAPYTAVEQLLSLKPLPGTAPASAKLARIKEVRDGAPDLAFSVCHRNQTSAEMISTVTSQQDELARNKDNKEYVKPSLMYDLPAEPCGPVRISKDTRTAYDRTQAAKYAQFRQLFGEEPESASIMKFRVIGIAPDPPSGASAGVDSLLGMIVSSSIGIGWYSPLELRESQPLVAKLFNLNPTSSFAGAKSYFVELPSPEEARRLIETENCNPNFDPTTINTDPFAKCAQEGKLFMYEPYGSSSLALDSAKQGFGRFFRIAAIIFTVIATIIMIGTVGRIIADSRRETAVFRAIGAKRLDIAQIYMTYTVFLALLIAAFAIITGYIISQVLQAKFSERLTVNALVAYNSQDLTKEVNLFAFVPRDILYLVGLVIIAGLVSAVLPLLSNLRRSPIKDMRDEN